jgi:hypothetical protein
VGRPRVLAWPYGGQAMGKRLLTVSVLVGGAIIAYRLLPEESRKRLAQLPGAALGWMMAHMPDE